MEAGCTRWAVLLAIAAACSPLRAEPASRCLSALATTGMQIIGNRAGPESPFEQVPSDCLKTFFLHCSREAGERVLALGEAAVCSVGYEVLLKREFGGDFDALLAWWRVRRPDPNAEPVDDDARR